MSFTRLFYHVIFSPKDRASMIAIYYQRDTYLILYNQLRKRNVKTIRIGGMPDHVHLLIEVPAFIAISELMQSLKRDTSVELKELIPGWGGWQEGYGAFTVAYGDVPAIKDYIINQKEHHRDVSFLFEYRGWLIENGVSSDDPYFP